jgi:hypothetical protein
VHFRAISCIPTVFLIYKVICSAIQKINHILRNVGRVSTCDIYILTANTKLSWIV